MICMYDNIQTTLNVKDLHGSVDILISQSVPAQNVT